MKSLGVDLSTKNTGLVLLEGNGTKVPTLHLETNVTYPEVEGIDRRIKIITRVMETIHSLKPDVIVVEGYSLNMKNASSVIPLVELGGLFRFMLKIDGLTWLDPRANEVKKFTTGKGNTPKSHMMMHVLKRWGHQSKDDNTADAYACACMGLSYSNKLPGITEDMRKIVGQLKIVCN